MNLLPPTPEYIQLSLYHLWSVPGMLLPLLAAPGFGLGSGRQSAAPPWAHSALGGGCMRRGDQLIGLWFMARLCVWSEPFSVTGCANRYMEGNIRCVARHAGIPHREHSRGWATRTGAVGCAPSCQGQCTRSGGQHTEMSCWGHSYTQTARTEL